MSPVVSVVPGRLHPPLIGAPRRRRQLEALLGGAGLQDASRETLDTALILLASTHTRHNVDALSTLCGLRREFVARCARRLHDNGIWQSGGVYCSWTAVAPLGDDFWYDVAVGEGKLCRLVQEDGFLRWAPAGYWHKSYGFIEREPAESSAVVYLPRTEAAGPSSDEDPHPEAEPEPTMAPHYQAPAEQVLVEVAAGDRGYSSAEEGDDVAPDGVLLGNHTGAVWLG